MAEKDISSKSRVRIPKTVGHLATEASRSSDRWHGYLDNVRTILGSDYVDMRVVKSEAGDVPKVLINDAHGNQADIAHLLQEGGKITRLRPHEVEGDMNFTIRKGPHQPEFGSKKSDVFKIDLEGPKGGLIMVSIDELVAPVNEENGKAWRLQIPEALPNTYEPAA